MGLFTRVSMISAEEARRRMGGGGSFILLDVRTPSEFRQIRIQGAKLLPVDELCNRAAKELPDKDVPILVYCQSGMRASNAVKMLTQLGYTDVVSFGGIMNWPYETVRG